MKRTIAAVCVAASMASVGLMAAERAKNVTLTGCVRAGGERNAFVLTKVEGADAPKSRGWKTGYLVKRPSVVALVAAGSSVRLKDHVGRRVSVNGTLEHKEGAQLKARSVRVLSSCS